MQPRFPIYIVSKGRYDSRITPRFLDAMNVDYLMVVEQQELDAYAAHIPARRLLVLDPAYKKSYETCDRLGDSKSTGSGPARNFAWDHAIAAGHERHWVMDDNIFGFYRLNRNRKIKIYDGVFFRIMEDFCLRYINIAMAGPNYDFFVPARQKKPPFTLNTRIFSCNLIRNDIPFRWRGRYNEDAILSLDILKAEWCTILFNALLQKKSATQTIKGGNTDELYRDGTRHKSEMLARVHPDVARVTWRFQRWHHHVDYRPFAKNRLVKKRDMVIPQGIDEFGMILKWQTGKSFHGQA